MSKLKMTELIESESYHIHTMQDKSNIPNEYSDQWVKGNIISFGDSISLDMNLLHDRVFNPYININWEKNFLKEISKKRITAKTIKDVKKVQTDFFQNGFLFKYFQLTREIVFEETRQTYFPDKPSRLSGVWLMRKENMEIWLKLIPKKHFPQKIFLVKFKGKVHKADGRWITNLTLSIDTIYENAISYWNGVPKSKKRMPHEEFIGNGQIEIIKEIA
jgi:hypothetical protein